jgi:phytoene dehydrogenase-like protein
MDYEAVIIGAGMSGLAAGIRLALFGRRVVIVERHSVIGGLNSYYIRGGRRFDVGLHAVTNYTPPEAKGTALAKIFRQLRIDRDAFALAPQYGSAIHFGAHRLCFDNNFALLESEVAREFPKQIDAFRRLDRDTREISATALDAPTASAREFIEARIADPALADALLLPVSYYGSARENDIDLAQFAIIWNALFHEGFARPREGVRQILDALIAQFRALGGELRLNCAVKKIEVRDNRATAVVLANGETLTAAKILSTAGLPETAALCATELCPAALPPPAVAPKPLAFVEGISVLREQPTMLGWHKTIIFFCDSDRLHYAASDELADPRSGVICIPNNYAYPTGDLPEGWLRVTALAGYAPWKALREKSLAAYDTAKRETHTRLYIRALDHLIQRRPFGPDLPHFTPLASDFFTPLTIERFTARQGGAIYGSPTKLRDGRTALANLYLSGTDQGFLGITGALLSGISIANLHLL